MDINDLYKNDVLFTSDLFKNSGILNYNEMKYVENLKFVHFYYSECFLNGFINNFLFFNNNMYYANHFSNVNINNDIKNVNSENNKRVKNKLSTFNYENIYFDKAIILYSNIKSVGHEFANIIHTIYLININRLEDFDIIISDQILNLGTFLLSVIDKFIPKEKIHYVNNNQIINIKETYINFPTSFFKTKISIDFLIDNIKLVNDISIKYDNVCLIKSTSSNNMQSSNRAFDNNYKEYFINNNFEIFDAEKFDVVTLFNIINNAKNIVLSWGCNSWINSTFVNRNSNLMVLCHSKYNNEFVRDNVNHQNYSNWIPICDKLVMVYDLESNFDENTKNLLDDKLSELLS